MGQTFSSFKNSMSNPFRSDVGVVEMANRKRNYGNLNDFDFNEKRLVQNQQRNYITSLEKQAKHDLPTNIKLHSIQRNNLIKKNSSHYVNSLAQPS